MGTFSEYIPTNLVVRGSTPLDRTIFTIRDYSVKTNPSFPRIHPKSPCFTEIHGKTWEKLGKAFDRAPEHFRPPNRLHLGAAFHIRRFGYQLSIGVKAQKMKPPLLTGV